MNSPRPPHVPEALVRHYDIYERLTGDGDFQGWFAGLHDRGYPDFFWTTANGGHWVVTRGAILNDVLTNPEVFSSRVAIVPVERQMATPPFPISLDPPEHTKYRAVLNGAFSPRVVTPLGEQAGILTRQLIDGFYARGGCEFMEEVSRILPISIFMRMVGVPDSDREMLLELVDEMIRPTQVDSNAANLGLTDYARRTVRERRANPGEDLLSRLCQAEVDGEKLSEDQLTGMTILLLLGGLDTVASVLGFTMNHLARHPDRRRELANNPDLIPRAVEELLRRFPVSSLGRIVTRDTEFHGVQLKKDDMVITPTMAHGMDDREFADPTAVDFHRKVVFHGTFGNGPHRCLGSMLARVELRAFLQEWLARIPDFRVEPGAELVVDTGMVVALHRLPLAWDVAGEPAP
ncbi:MAG TPA: cytochrome P450 [Porticoccaceae bacterium]|nr:cytochrome P450 [Porticoccaceae bacterium]